MLKVLPCLILSWHIFYVVQTYDDTGDQDTRYHMDGRTVMRRVMNHQLLVVTNLNLIMVPTWGQVVRIPVLWDAQPAGFDNTPHVMSSVKRADNSANIYMDGSSVISGH